VLAQHEEVATMAVKGGARFAVNFDEIFPAGCLLIHGSIGPVEDYDEKTGRRTPSTDKVTGGRVWQARVVDLDPELGTRARETVVKILAPVQPVPPSGEAMCPVEFEGLTVTPYVNEKNKRLAYSLRATGMRAPSVGIKPRHGSAEPGDGKAA
jgi:hypothetical protein